ncbi:MAG: hypothetical protein EOS84_11195 [Mesorhizobium sp.]|nr:MAG: hypothetical protein EOS84_11195 [Mesorhizobium sp.]
MSTATQVQGSRFRPIAVAQSAKPPISPLAGEMPGRAEGGAVPRPVSQLQPRRQTVFGWEWFNRELAILPTPLCPAGHLPRKGGDWMPLRLSPTTKSWNTGQGALQPEARVDSGRPNPFAVVDGHRANA